MIKTIMKIDGMSCGMCESHINDVIRQNFQIKKVSSSHAKGETTILSDGEIDEALAKKVIADTGYTLISLTSEPYEKKGFSFFKRK